MRMFVIGNSESVYQNPLRLKGLVQLSYGKRHRGTAHIICVGAQNASSSSREKLSDPVEGPGLNDFYL